MYALAEAQRCKYGTQTPNPHFDSYTLISPELPAAHVQRKMQRLSSAPLGANDQRNVVSESKGAQKQRLREDDTVQSVTRMIETPIRVESKGIETQVYMKLVGAVTTGPN